MSLFGFRNVDIHCADRTFDRSTIFPSGLVHYGDADDSGESGKSAEFAKAVRESKWRLVINLLGHPTAILAVKINCYYHAIKIFILSNNCQYFFILRGNTANLLIITFSLIQPIQGVIIFCVFESHL